MNNLIEKIIADITAKKENLIKQALFDYLGFDLDILAESQKRFPSLTCVIKGDEESYYWNNGTKEGKRIITFVSVTNHVLSADLPSITPEIKYY